MTKYDTDEAPTGPGGESEPQEQPAESADLSPEAVADELRRKLSAVEAEARANHDRFLRERAELENFKKRMQRERTEALRFACESLARDLLPVVDNLERALEHEDGNGESLREGLRLVLQSLLSALERHGVKLVEGKGQAFDPTVHQAFAMIESAKHAPNQVVEQHQRGYMLHDRLLRPALVTVSATPRTDATSKGADDEVESNGSNG